MKKFQNDFAKNYSIIFYLKKQTKHCSIKIINASLKLFLLFAVLLSTTSTKALQGDTFIHDPSSIVKDGNTYWIFYTGDGVGTKYSTDLINWAEGRRPYSQSVWPSWIKGFANTFNGSFWAPECIYMNGLYYLYYAAAGSGQCCIGLVTTPSLNNPTWTDKGVVVSSVAANDNTNAIDPDVFFDKNGKLWLTYGSWLGGIRMVELNTGTGKPINNMVYNPCNLSDAENSQVVKNGNYYYMFVNRGLCCRDASSTYYVQVGRSTTPTGPYAEWRTVLSTKDNFIGPGGLGYYSEGATEYASFHYYDGNSGGRPTLAIGKYTWSGGWPSINLNWVDNNSYKITSTQNGLVWDSWGCKGVASEPVAQGTWSNYLCQKWNFTHLGNGYYKITNAFGGMAAGTLSCKADANAPMDTYYYNGWNCQTWRIERTSTGSYVISSKGGNRVVNVPGASVNPGQQLSLADFTGVSGQKWNIDFVSTAKIATPDATTLAITEKPTEADVSPNPSRNGEFTITLGSLANTKVLVTVYNAQGQQVYKQSIVNAKQVLVKPNLKLGAYVIKIQNAAQVVTKKILIQ